MSQNAIGIRDQGSSRWSPVITDRGKPLAELAEKVQSMLDSGMASWSGQKPSSELPRVSVQGPKTLAELLLEDR